MLLLLFVVVDAGLLGVVLFVAEGVDLGGVVVVVVAFGVVAVVVLAFGAAVAVEGTPRECRIALAQTPEQLVQHRLDGRVVVGGAGV